MAGNYWDEEVEEYLKRVRERAARPLTSCSFSRRVGRAISAPIQMTLIYFSVPLLLALPWSFPFTGGLIFLAVLLGWFIALVADVALVIYVVMTGRPPTWDMILARIRLLLRPALRW